MKGMITMNKMLINNVNEQVQQIQELSNIVECSEEIKCKTGGRPFMQDEVETTHYCVKDDKGHVFKLLVPPYLMIGAGLLKSEKEAREMTENFFVHQAVVLNELMCKIFGVREFCDNDNLRCCTLSEVSAVWNYARMKHPYKGEYFIGQDKYRM